MKLNRLSCILAFGLLFSCSEIKEANLENFSNDGDVFTSGESLISLAFGLHALEATTANQNTLLIGVHGSNSRGYEWVYPLQVLDKETNLISFFRWNDKGCPNPSVISLLEIIKSKLDSNPQFERVVLLGHSYGGLLVTAFAEAWDLKLPLEIHSIASPLLGMGGLSSICEYWPPDSLNTGVTLHQWRTVQELDGAFKDLDFDPQVVEIKDSSVTRLPETYKGNKLGHNWSISWVADEILGLNQ
jgi:hypothetical protein